MLGSVRQIINEISELVYEPQRNAKTNTTWSHDELDTEEKLMLLAIK